METGIAVLHGMEVNVVGFRRGRKRNAEIDILYVLSCQWQERIVPIPMTV